MITDEQYEEIFLSLLDKQEGLSLFDKRNKMVALMMSGELNEARDLLLEVISVDGDLTSQYNFTLLGILDALLETSKNLELTFPQWEKASRAMYRDAGGGVELWILWKLHARITRRSEREFQADSQLKKFMKTKGGSWPGVLAKVAMGLCEQSEVETLMDEHPFLRKKQEVLLAVALEASNDNPSISKLYSRVSHHRIAGYTLPEFHYARLLANKA